MHSYFTFPPKDTSSMLNVFSQPPNFQNTNTYFQAINLSNVKIPSPNNFMTLSPTESRTRASSVNSLSPMNNFTPINRPNVPMTPEVENFLLRLKMQQNIQTELFKNQMQQLIDIKNTLLTKLNEQQKQLDQQTHLSTPQPLIRSFSQDNKHVNETIKVEPLAEVPIKTFKEDFQNRYNEDTKSQVKNIVHFILENFGRISEDRIEEEKQKYSFSKDLVAVFDIVVSKYSSTIKTKEEMVKYTLRRAFKFIKNNVKKEGNTNTKGVSKVLCNKYFKPSEDDISKLGDEESFLKFVLPFRKNSKNKTMNTSFISEVFASDEFARDYEVYLENFDDILEADNKGKVEKFISFIEEAIKKGKIKEIKSYKRIPWPKLWILNTKNIAQSLPTIGIQSIQNSNSESPVKKHVKGDDIITQNNLRELRNNECESEISTDSNSNF